MQKRNDTEMEEKKRKQRHPGAKVSATDRSFAEILQQSPTLEDKAEVDFKEKDCAKSLDQMN